MIAAPILALERNTLIQYLIKEVFQAWEVIRRVSLLK